MKGLDTRARTGILVGALAMFFALDVAFIVSLAGVPFAPLSLGQAIIEVLPGWISIPLIELFQHWAQRLLVIGVVALYLASGTIAGIAALDPGRRDRVVVSLAVAPWLLTVVLAQLFAAAHLELGALLVDAGAGLAVFAASLALLRSAGQYRVPVPAPSRRRALYATFGVAALVAFGGLKLGPSLRIARAAGENVVATARNLVFRETVPPPDPQFEKIERLTPRITANADHYTVDTTLFKPQVDTARWTLAIRGNVEQPFELTYDELLELPSVEQLHTLECISNEVGGDLISTALWTGVPLRDLLARAKPKNGAFDVILRSVDDYSDSIPIAKALEAKTIVAYLMNGVTLPIDHGFPARLLVPNIYGMKNVKWLKTVEVATFDYFGYWQERGWNDAAIVNVGSRFDAPVRTVRWDGGQVAVAGIAFAGARGISKVEVSVDGGQPWVVAELETALGALTWRRWLYRWTPDGVGPKKLLVRATDGAGLTQTAVRREPFPSGATGYDTIEIQVVR
ncbi:MAG: molybdopterin-dependent oxidoreductase [Chloroflexi bacterium]|nr:molybdopterin-dependent oxidoreductase [Chloroflexota bacterium]